jgi:hypothetical protein
MNPFQPLKMMKSKANKPLSLLVVLSFVVFSQWIYTQHKIQHHLETVPTSCFQCLVQPDLLDNSVSIEATIKVAFEIHYDVNLTQLWDSKPRVNYSPRAPPLV